MFSHARTLIGTALLASACGSPAPAPAAPAQPATCERVLDHLAAMPDAPKTAEYDSAEDCRVKTNEIQRRCMLETKSSWHARSCLEHENPSVAHALLDRYIGLFRLVNGGAGRDVIMSALDELRTDAKAHSGESKGDFDSRFAILLGVIPPLFDPPTELQRNQLGSFVKNVTGEAVPDEVSFADVAPAIGEEVLRLYMELDEVTDREAAIKRYVPELGEN